MQVLLASPSLVSDEDLRAVEATVAALEGAEFVSGEAQAHAFVVDLASGAALDALAVSLEGAGYPLGPVITSSGAHEGGAPHDWRPASFRIEPTEVGANVNYDCYCGCDAGFALDRSEAEPAPESCCCGNHILVGADAAERIMGRVEDADRYRLDVQRVTMPWGEAMDVAIAIPRGS
jgi:hypothetical protein